MSFGMIPLGVLAAASSGGAAGGPDSWDPWHYWPAANAVDGADFSWPSNAGASFVQTTDANEPTVNASDGDYGGQPTVQMIADTAAIDTGTWSLASQRDLHDGTQTYYGHAIYESLDASTTRIVESNSNGTGIGVELRCSPGSICRFRIRNGSGIIATVQVDGWLQDTPGLIEWYYDVSEDEVGIAINGGSWVTASLTGSPATGDAATALNLNPSGISSKCAWIGLYTSIPDASRREEIMEYFQSLGTLPTP